jgi:hypothetical protein
MAMASSGTVKLKAATTDLLWYDQDICENVPKVDQCLRLQPLEGPPCASAISVDGNPEVV